MNKEQNLKEMIDGLVWGGSIVVVALAASLARKMGYMDDEIVKRLVIGMTGLMIAWYGNRMPKTFVPSACGRQARRIAAWSLVLSGLVYAGLWAFAPIRVAVWLGSAAVLGGIVVTFGYCFSMRAKAKTD
jgi:hypothetical protein